MAVISIFYGLAIYMFYMDNRQHHLAHIHVRYQDEEAILSIPDGKLLSGSLPASKMKLVQAWIEIHSEDLMTNWGLAVKGRALFRIAPLR